MGGLLHMAAPFSALVNMWGRYGCQEPFHGVRRIIPDIFHFFGNGGVFPLLDLVVSKRCDGGSHYPYEICSLLVCRVIGESCARPYQQNQDSLVESIQPAASCFVRQSQRDLLGEERSFFHTMDPAS